MGRLACLLIGLFFGGIGSCSLWVLVANRRDVIDALALYEGSAIAVVFGGCLILWAIFRPAWVHRLALRIAKHLILFIAVLFVPIAIRAMVALLSGDI